MRNPRRFYPGGRASCLDCGGQQLLDRRIADEPLLISIRRGVIARSVTIDEIAGQAGMTRQPRRRILSGPDPCRAVTISKLRRASWLGVALFCRDYDLVLATQQRIEQCRSTCPAAVGEIGGANTGGERQGIDQQGALRAIREVRRCRCEADRLRRRCDQRSRRLDRHRHGVLVPSGNRAKPRTRHRQPGPRQFPGGQLAVEPEHRKVASHRGNADLHLALRYHSLDYRFRDHDSHTAP